MNVIRYASVIAVALILAGCSHNAGMEGSTAGDKPVVAGSRYSVVRDAVFANP